MSWEILLTISLLTSVTGTLLSRVMLKEESSDPVAFSVVVNLLAGLIIAFFAFFHGFSFAHITEIIPNLILMVILYGGGNLLMFYALKLIEASEFTIFFTTRALWSAFAAIIVLHEVFLPRQFFGMLLILAGVILVTLKKNKITLGKGAVLSLLCAAFLGLHFVNSAVILHHLDAYTYVPIYSIIPNLFVWLVFPKSTKHIVALVTTKAFPKVLILGVFYAISGLTYQLSYQVGHNAAEIASINQVQTILAVIAATLFLHETKGYIKKITASIVTFVGVILVK